jgi:hypothetical protein
MLPLAVVPAQASAGAKRTCTAKGAKTVVKNRYARVFTARGAGAGSVPDPAIKRRLIGCLYSTGRRVVLAVDYDEGPDISGKFSQVTLSGRFAAWQYENYDISCKADCPPDYNPRALTINVANLRTRRTRGVAGSARARTLAVNRRGTATWIDDPTGERRSFPPR